MLGEGGGGGTLSLVLYDCTCYLQPSFVIQEIQQTCCNNCKADGKVSHNFLHRSLNLVWELYVYSRPLGFNTGPRL